MTNTTDKPSPIEVVLTQSNMEVQCLLVHEDESIDHLSINSLSMRGAQREITGSLIADGYAPVGRWEVEARDGDEEAVETIRRFKLA
jgi:hypothetical protein